MQGAALAVLYALRPGMVLIDDIPGSCESALVSAALAALR
jgi:hypothetical protein